MPRPRKLTDDQLRTVAKLHERGGTPEQIAAGIGGVSARSISRALAALGVARRGPTSASPSDPSRIDPGASSKDSDEEAIILEESIRILRAELACEIPAADKARVASTLSSLCVRRSVLGAAAQRASSGVRSEVAARLIQRVERLHEVAETERDAHRARVAALVAGLPPMAPEFRARLVEELHRAPRSAHPESALAALIREDVFDEGISNAS